MGLITTSRFTFHSCPEYLVEFQFIEGQFHVHCTVNKAKFTKSILGEGYGIFVQLEDFARSVKAPYMVSISPNRKFCEVFGAICVGEQEGYEVMLWDLR